MSEPAKVFARAFASAIGDADAAAVAERYWAQAAPFAARWSVSAERFGQFLSTRAGTPSRLLETQPHARELVLACACLDGHSAALATLESEYLRALRTELGTDGNSFDDIVQLVSEKLLVGPNPKLATYSGRGELRRFLKAIATRVSVDRHRTKREVPSEDAFFAQLISAHDPEREAVRARYREELTAALAEAWAQVPPRDRLWLRQYYLDGLRLERIGAMHGVVASTVSRALEKSRLALLHQVAASLEARGIPAQDVNSVLNLVGSRLSLPGA
jgi:RNA polymerase sigma-70 factor (ECF subfamily)